MSPSLDDALIIDAYRAIHDGTGDSADDILVSPICALVFLTLRESIRP